MFKKIILAIILSAISLLIFIGFKGDLLPGEYLVLTVIILFLAYLFRNKFPLFAKIIFILVGSLIPAYAIGILGLFVILFIFTWGNQSVSVPCDMGGRGITALIFGIITGVITYILSVIMSSIYFYRKNKKVS